MGTKEYHILKAHEAKRRKFAFIKQLKETTPCTDCKKVYPHYVMDFDHINDDKIDSVAKLVVSKAWKTVLDEIAKCELVCSNCHRERSWQRMLSKDGSIPSVETGNIV